MRPTVFADTFYWLALARPRDSWHTAARRWATANTSSRIVTTDEVLTEFLNALAGTGPLGRGHASATVHDIRNDPQVTVLPQTRADFDAATAAHLYAAANIHALADFHTAAAGDRYTHPAAIRYADSTAVRYTRAIIGLLVRQSDFRTY